MNAFLINKKLKNNDTKPLFHCGAFNSASDSLNLSLSLSYNIYYWFYTNHEREVDSLMNKRICISRHISCWLYFPGEPQYECHFYFKSFLQIKEITDMINLFSSSLLLLLSSSLISLFSSYDPELTTN